MPDIITTIFTNNDFLAFLTILLIMVTWLGVTVIANKRKGTRIPSKLFILVTFLWVGMFITQGLLSPSYAVLIIVALSGLITYFYNQIFFGQLGSEDKVFMSYLVFFISMIFFQVGIIATPVISGTFNSQSIEPCGLGGNFLTYIFDLGSCAIRYLTVFINISSLSSSFAIINTIIVIPFVYFLVKYIFDWLRGRGG